MSKRADKSLNRIDMAQIYRSYGIPYYLKVDVEGVDRLVVEELNAFEERPQYLSLESEKRDFDQLVAEMELLDSLGYNKFKIVQQQFIPGTKFTTHAIDGQLFDYVFQSDASGPFGDDLPQPWLTYGQALKEYKSIYRRYKFFGDYSYFQNMPGKAQEVVRGLYGMITGYRGPLPGWFDTHASL